MSNSANLLDADLSVTCDCGNPLADGADVCTRCTWLDGSTGAEQRVIALLNECGGTGTREMLASEAGVCERSIWRALKRLRAIGRIAVLDDGECPVYALRGSADPERGRARP